MLILMRSSWISPAIFGARDIRQVVRRRDSPPGGQTIGAAQDDRQHEPPAPVVDLVTGKCKPGKVSRTVSTSLFTLDLTVMCTSGVKFPMPGASTQVVLPPATVAGTVSAVGMSTSFIASPAPVVEQPGMHARKFRTVVLVSLALGLLSSSPSPTLLWGAAEDSSPPSAGHSQDVPDEGSFFNVSPLSPGLFFRPPRGSKSPPTGGVLLPTTLENFDDSVLGDPITYAWCEKFPGSESPLSLPSGSTFLLDPTVLQTVLASGTSSLPAEGTSSAALPMDSGEGRLLETGLPGCPYRFSESGWQPGIWIAASSYSVSGACGSSGVGPTPRLLTNVLGGSVAQGTSGYQRDAGVMLSNLQILSQFAMAMNRMSFSIMALGLGQSLFPRVEVE